MSSDDQCVRERDLTRFGKNVVSLLLEDIDAEIDFACAVAQQPSTTNKIKCVFYFPRA